MGQQSAPKFSSTPSRVRLRVRPSLDQQLDLPSISSDHVRSLNSFLRTVGVNDFASVTTSLLLDTLVGPIQHVLIQIVPFRSGDLQIDAEARVHDHHLVQNVVAVANPSDGATLQCRE